MARKPMAQRKSRRLPPAPSSRRIDSTSIQPQSPRATSSPRSLRPRMRSSIIQLLRLPDQTVKVLVEGRSRASIRSFTQSEPYFACDIELLEEDDG